MPTAAPERRYLAGGEACMIEVRESDAGPELFGYAARFDSDSEPIYGEFVERIAPGAFSEVLKDDAALLFNHDANEILGRNGGTLEIGEDGLGLWYRARLDPANPAAAKVLSAVRRKDVRGNSFAFTVAKAFWDETTTPVRRTVEKVARLYDVGPVVYPAYPATSVGLRDAETALAELRALREARAEDPAVLHAHRRRLLDLRARELS